MGEGLLLLLGDLNGRVWIDKANVVLKLVGLQRGKFVKSEVLDLFIEYMAMHMVSTARQKNTEKCFDVLNNDGEGKRK